MFLGIYSRLLRLEFLSGFLPSLFRSTKCYSWKGLKKETDVKKPDRAAILGRCAAHIGMDGMRIEKEPRQKDEYVYRTS